MDKNLFMASLNFTQDDLNSNKMGQISESQKKRIKKSGHIVSIILLVLTAILLAAFLLLTKKPITVQSYIFAGIFCGLLIILSIWFSLRAHNAANKGVVKSVTGPVSYQYVRRYLYLYIENMRFPVIASYKQTMPQGKAFTVYYSPGDKNILSAEEV
jgi:hypothetical protein